MNRLDRLINYINPEIGMKRARARVLGGLFGSAYTGASHTKRSLRNWGVRSSIDPDDDVLPELDTLRDRSRDLYRNNPIGGGAIKNVKTNVIGTGLWFQSRIDREYLKKAVGLTDAQADIFENEINRLFHSWAGYTDADAGRRENFYGLQNLSFLTFLMAGESFTILPLIPRAGTVSDLRVQVIDADRVSNPDGRLDTGTIASGIELGRYGEPLAYYIETTPPGLNVVRTWTRVMGFGASSGRQNVIHLYEQDRPGQRRGVPFLTPVIDVLKSISRYSESELMAALVSSMYTVFVKSPNADDGILDNATGDVPPTGSPPPPPAPAGMDAGYELGPGAIVGLGDGEEIEIANPGRPNAQYDPFMQAHLKQIGMALEIPYECLTKAFQSSFSAARGALMEGWKKIKTWRSWFADKWCQVIVEDFITEMVLAGKIEAPGFFDSVMVRRAYFGSEWIGDAPIQLDPTKEVAAAEKRLSLNLSSKTTETMALTGADWNATVRQIAKEKALEKTLGVDAAPAPAPVMSAAPSPMNQTEKDETNAEEDNPDGEAE